MDLFLGDFLMFVLWYQVRTEPNAAEVMPEEIKEEVGRPEHCGCHSGKTSQ